MHSYFNIKKIKLVKSVFVIIYLNLGLKLNNIGYFVAYINDFAEIVNGLQFFDNDTSNDFTNATIPALACVNPNFMPGQIRGPSPNGIKIFFIPLLPSFVKRSGINLSGSGYKWGSLM